MEPSDGQGPRARDGSGQPSVAPSVDILEGYERQVGDGTRPSESFQTLANEVRVAVLVRLLAAERENETPLSFTELQRAADADSSAGFAYHLRQLDGSFVEEDTEGYVLTPAGRRIAEAVVAGTFTPEGGDAAGQAS